MRECGQGSEAPPDLVLMPGGQTKAERGAGKVQLLGHRLAVVGDPPPSAEGSLPSASAALCHYFGGALTQA